jgi:fructokinase
VPLPTPEDDERPGPRCSCGVLGHTEAWLSGPSFAADYARRKGMPVEDAPRAQDIVAQAASGNPDAQETVRRYEDRLGRSLAMIVNLLDPDVIVLGGGMSNVARLYQTVPGLMQPHVFGDKFNTRLVQNRHGDSSGVRGAAWL